MGREDVLDVEEDQSVVSSAIPLGISRGIVPRRASDATTVTSWDTLPRTALLSKTQRATPVGNQVTSSVIAPRLRSHVREVPSLQTAGHATCVERLVI